MLGTPTAIARSLDAQACTPAERLAVAAMREGRATGDDLVTFLESKLRGTHSAQHRQDFMQKIQLIRNGYTFRYTIDHATDRVMIEVSNTIPPENDYAEQVRAWAREYAAWFFHDQSTEDQADILQAYCEDPDGFLQDMFWGLVESDQTREPWQMVIQAEEFGVFLDDALSVTL
jgi:hypothetical protein